MYKLRISTFMVVMSLVALFTSCSNDGSASLGQENPVATKPVKNLPKQSITFDLQGGNVDVNPMTVLAQENEEQLRGLYAKLGKTIAKGQKIHIINKDLFKVLMVFRCTSDASIPYFYKEIYCKQKEGGRENQEFVYDDHIETFTWEGKSFEQLRSENATWEAMFFLANPGDYEDLKNGRDVVMGATSPQKLQRYTIGQEKSITGLDIPFYSKWEPVTFIKRTKPEPNKPTYTIKVGAGYAGHTKLNPQGVLVRVHFDNKINLPVTVKGFTVETNSYAIKGAYNISRANLEADNKPKFIPDTDKDEINVLGEDVFKEKFKVAQPILIPAMSQSTEDCLFWMMPMEQMPAKPYTQIYLSGEVKGYTTTNANGFRLDDSFDALKSVNAGGKYNHGAVANTPVSQQAPSIKHLPVYKSEGKQHTVAALNGKSLHAILNIERPKTFIEWIAETPIVRPTISRGGVEQPVPIAGALGFATDLSYPDEVYHMYEMQNGKPAINPAYANLTGHERSITPFHYSYDEALAFIKKVDGYKMPEAREVFSYCLQPTKGYESRGYDVEEGYLDGKGEFYKAYTNPNEPNAVAKEYKTYISGSQTTAKGHVVYAMRFVDDGNKKYQVAVRYFWSSGKPKNKYYYYRYDNPNKKWWDVEQLTGVYPEHNGKYPLINNWYENLPDRQKEKKNTEGTYIPENAYLSVRVRYLGANYVFDKLADAPDVWANETFWANDNRDDVVRYFPMYGYSYNMCFRAVGVYGMYWLNDREKLHAGWGAKFDPATGDVLRKANGDPKLGSISVYDDVFSITQDGLFEKGDYLKHHYAAKYGMKDQIASIPQVTKDWGE